MITKKFQIIISHILSQRGDIEKITQAILHREEVYVRYKNPGFDDLVIEVMPNTFNPNAYPALLVGYCHEQNGDLVFPTTSMSMIVHESPVMLIPYAYKDDASGININALLPENKLDITEARRALSCVENLAEILKEQGWA